MGTCLVEASNLVRHRLVKLLYYPEDSLYEDEDVRVLSSRQQKQPLLSSGRKTRVDLMNVDDYQRKTGAYIILEERKWMTK
jgi:hypothetical protein